MFRTFLLKLLDLNNKKSIVAKFRKKRDIQFKQVADFLEKKVTILDVGGTEQYWKNLGYCGDLRYEITLLNLYETESSCSNMQCVKGDGRNLTQFQDKEFDIVFSNSVLEHVGGFEDQNRMAIEMRRVGKSYFLQTPHRFIPLEPHFVFPFFQILPEKIKLFLVQHLNLGYFNRIKNPHEAECLIRSIRLLNKRELKMLFPEAMIREEKIFGIPYSFLVFSGFHTQN